MESVDVAVVGSGFGGLTAAALAAHGGLSVALFERHTRPGGCAGDFALEGFWFPAGATVVTGLELGGILRQVFDTVGAEAISEEIDPSIVFETPTTSIGYTRDLGRWKSELAHRFVAASRYDAFWEWTHETGGAVYDIGASLPSLPLERWADVRRSWGTLTTRTLRLLPQLNATVQDIKRKTGATGSPEIDAIIDSLLLDATGATARECSAIQGAIALDLYRRGCQWVEGGTGRLAMSLVRAIRAAGGDVRFGAGIARIARDGRAWLVETEDGRTIRAGSVIANVPPAGLDRLLGRRVRPTRPGEAWGPFVLHLGIDARGLAPLHPYHQVLPGDGPWSLVSIFPSRKRDEPRWSVSASTHVRPIEWEGFPGEVACRRSHLEEALVSNVERVIPDVRDRILLQRSATPRTFERYTSRPGGYAGGLVQRPGVVALRAPGHRAGRGLFLAGDHVFPGQGTVGTALSGINAYRDASEYLGRGAIL